MRLRVVAAAAVAALLGLVAATASASPQRAQANKLTVWLQVDAQSGWPDIGAAAIQQFDATIAGNTTPDVIEMGNTEMTKYMAAGAFADLTSAKSQFANSSNWLAGLAKSGMYGGKVYGVPYY